MPTKKRKTDVHDELRPEYDLTPGWPLVQVPLSEINSQRSAM
jgi:hypothetical protein